MTSMHNTPTAVAIHVLHQANEIRQFLIVAEHVFFNGVCRSSKAVNQFKLFCAIVWLLSEPVPHFRDEGYIGE